MIKILGVNEHSANRANPFSGASKCSNPRNVIKKVDEPLARRSQLFRLVFMMSNKNYLLI